MAINFTIRLYNVCGGQGSHLGFCLSDSFCKLYSLELKLFLCLSGTKNIKDVALSLNHWITVL